MTAKIWNLPRYPVYSLSTLNPDGTYNMNICTYAIPVSMKPKMYCIAIYYGTKTYEDVMRDNRFVLQLLSDTQQNLLRVFGKSSGLKKSKDGTIRKQKYVLVQELPVLQDACGYMCMEVVRVLPAVEADHALCLCHVLESKVFSTSPLYWQM